MSFRGAHEVREPGIQSEVRSLHLDSGSRASRGPGMTKTKLLLPRQLALAGLVFAVVPLDELAVLDHVFGDDRDGVLSVIVEGDLADDGVAILHVTEIGDH